MGRRICIVLLRIVSVFFILLGTLSFVPVFEIWERSDLPVSLWLPCFSFGFACILLGILSFKRADRFGSTLSAFLLLLARILTFSVAYIFSFGLFLEIDKSIPNSAFEFQAEAGIVDGVVVLIFLGLTFWLTLVNQERSRERVTCQISGRYVIDPRDFRTDRVHVGLLVAFWLIWAPASAIIICGTYNEGSPFFLVWLVFGSLGTIGIPMSIFTRNRKQILEVTGKSLVVYGTQGHPWSRVEIDKENLHALTLERYESPDRESVYTLNLFQEPGVEPHRIMLASYVHPKDKAILFEEIGEFLQKNGFEFQVKNEMTSWVET